MSSDSVLPTGFSDLERFVTDWALPENMQRYRKRTRSTMQELQEFYEAVQPMAQDALALLDSYPIKELRGAESRLMLLLLSLIDVSLAIEVYRTPILKLSPAPERFAVTMDGMTFD